MQKKISETIRSSADAIVLSGANAWGPFFAVKGKDIIHLRQESPSDIDMFGIFEDEGHLESAMDKLATLFPDSDIPIRVKNFLQLFSSKKADVLSLRVMRDGRELSFHAYLRKTFEMIISGTEPKNDLGIGFIQDYRSNTIPN